MSDDERDFAMQMATVSAEVVGELEEVFMQIVERVCDRHGVSATDASRTQILGQAVMAFAGMMLGKGLLSRDGPAERSARITFEKTLALNFEASAEFRVRDAQIKASRNASKN